jgi:hypothetical protein
MTFSLQYLSVVDSLILVLDPFMLPGARAFAGIPESRAIAQGETPLNVVNRITEVLRTQRKVRPKKRMAIPVAVVFTKIDAFYSRLSRDNPLNEEITSRPIYDELQGQTIHEHVLSLMKEWGADDIDSHLRVNYDRYRYFGISALGAEPDYSKARVADAGVQPHRVEEPVLWLLREAGVVTSK